MYHLKLLVDYAKTEKKFESRTNEYKQYLIVRYYKPSFVNKQFQNVSKINTQTLKHLFSANVFSTVFTRNKNLKALLATSKCSNP